MDIAKRNFDRRFVAIGSLATIVGIAGALCAQEQALPRDNNSSPAPKMGPIVHCALSADGKRIAAGDSNRVVWVWNVRQRRLIRAVHDHSINSNTLVSYAFSQDCKYAVVGNRPGVPIGRVPDVLASETLTFWNLEDGVMIRAMEMKEEPVFAVALSPDGKRALSVSHWKTLKNQRIGVLISDGELGADRYVYALKLWDTTSGKLIRQLNDDCGPSPAALSVGGKFCVFGSVGLTPLHGDRRKWSFQRWKAGDGLGAVETQMAPSWGGMDIWAIAISPDGKRLALGHYGGSSLWNVDTGKLEWSHDNQIRVAGGIRQPWTTSSIAFSSDGKRIVASGPGIQATHQPLREINGGIAVLDAVTGKNVPGFAATREWVGSLSFTPADDQLVGAAIDGIRFWDAMSGKSLYTLQN